LNLVNYTEAVCFRTEKSEDAVIYEINKDVSVHAMKE
jgi:hypothetical protein